MTPAGPGPLPPSAAPPPGDPLGAALPLTLSTGPQPTAAASMTRTNGRCIGFPDETVHIGRGACPSARSTRYRPLARREAPSRERSRRCNRVAFTVRIVADIFDFVAFDRDTTESVREIPN